MNQQLKNEAKDEGEESDNNSDVNDDTFVANDKAIEAVQNNQAFEVEMRKQMMNQLLLKKKQIQIVKQPQIVTHQKRMTVAIVYQTQRLTFTY